MHCAEVHHELASEQEGVYHVQMEKSELNFVENILLAPTSTKAVGSSLARRRITSPRLRTVVANIIFPCRFATTSA